MKVPIKNVKEDDLEVAVHQQDDDSNASAEESKFNGCIKTLRVTQLRVVRYTLAQHEQVNDWRKNCHFQTCTKNWEQKLQGDS